MVCLELNSDPFIPHWHGYITGIWLKVLFFKKRLLITKYRLKKVPGAILYVSFKESCDMESHFFNLKIRKILKLQAIFTITSKGLKILKKKGISISSIFCTFQSIFYLNSCTVLLISTFSVIWFNSHNTICTKIRKDWIEFSCS